jgi:hypothetical protein
MQFVIPITIEEYIYTACFLFLVIDLLALIAGAPIGRCIEGAAFVGLLTLFLTGWLTRWIVQALIFITVFLFTLIVGLVRHVYRKWRNVEEA